MTLIQKNTSKKRVPGSARSLQGSPGRLGGRSRRERVDSLGKSPRRSYFEVLGEYNSLWEPCSTASHELLGCRILHMNSMDVLCFTKTNKSTHLRRTLSASRPSSGLRRFGRPGEPQNDRPLWGIDHMDFSGFTIRTGEKERCETRSV